MKIKALKSNTRPVAEDIQMQDSMNQMYCWVRYIYDVTRKHYLIGRDDMIDGLDAKPGQYICELGCGTARNLIKMANAYPEAKFYGLDISDEMLKTAHKSLQKKGMESSIPLAHGSAHLFNAKKSFNLEKPFFDKIVFSYSLSIIPIWRECLDHALSLLSTGGEIHIIDFGSIKSHPGLIRKFMSPWLSMFHVYFGTGIEEQLKHFENKGKGQLNVTPLSNDRAYYAVFRRN